MSRNVLTAVALATATFALACGKGEQAQPAESTQAAAAPASAPAASGAQTPDAGGVIDTVMMITDGTGNYFKPKDFTVHQGDVIRYTLGVGVHNVSFPADSNKGAQGLPGPSELLQLPGQTYDVKVNFNPGTYYYQCDAHAALGMVGHIKVEAKK
ncbi:MAG TPA: plastocyanin/azurin family copper-binding protein [Gemmatimonadaceae bacterium]|nr:plastocyanin/azurin family copper-binding protein [Gemmatimonadaceae bacterium]